MFKVVTDYPVALESPDHLSTLTSEPTGGPSKDNSKNPNFNKKLYSLFNDEILCIMDLGCSGGGFVEDCLNDGHIAIGLEGSDYSLKNKRACWETIPESLFTCDCTKPFQIVYNEIHPIFDVITSWEFAEHIQEKDWPQLCENVRKHLKKNGFWIMSISTCWGPPYHQTIQTRDWWLEMFEKEGFINRQDLVEYFDKDFVRIDAMSFHVVLQYGN